MVNYLKVMYQMKTSNYLEIIATPFTRGDLTNTNSKWHWSPSILHLIKLIEKVHTIL